jgi:transposase
MPRTEAPSIKSTIKRAKASSVYRKLKLPQQRAAWLHVEHGISQTRAAEEEGVSRGAVQRALAAEAENREVGHAGRPGHLTSELEETLKCTILQRSSGLDCMNLDEVRAEVWELQGPN